MAKKRGIHAKIRIILTIVMVIFQYSFFVSSSVFSEDAPFTPEEIIRKAIDAQGGEKALREQENRNNYTWKASNYSSQGIHGIYILNFKKPAKMREEYYLISEGLTITRIYNAGSVYITQNGRVVDDQALSEKEIFKKRGEERDKFGTFLLLYFLDHQDKINYIGEEVIDSKRCLGLGFTIDKDIRGAYFFDVNTFLPLKGSKTIYSPKGNVEESVYYYDFQKVDNILFPFHLEVYQDGNKTSDMRINEISFDELDDSLFEIPEGKKEAL